MKKTVSLIILLALLIQLAACGGEALPDETTASETTPEETTIDMSSVNELPDKKWDGREFRVLGRESAEGRTQFNNFEIYAESENGDLVNDAVFRRNSRIEDKYDVKITQVLVDLPHNELRTSVLAQEDLYDLAFVELESIGSVAAEGYFYDLNDVDYIDFSKSYWNQEVNDSLTIGKSLYFTSSDFSLRDKNRVYIMAHNRDMLKDYKLGSVVDLVREGKWTADVMKEYTKAIYADVNNDGSMTIEDNWGVGFDSYNAFSALMYAQGARIAKSVNGEVTLAMNSEHTVSAVDKALAIAKNGLFCNDFQGKVDFDFWDTAGRMFYAKQQLFMMSFPHSLKTYSEKCDFDYGIIPLPKYDESQEKYYTMADIYFMLFGIPITTPDPDFTGFMLEAHSSDSQEVLYNYYELTCKVKHTYDEDSAEMLDIIFDGIVYDLGSIYDIGLKSLWLNIAQYKENDFSSAYASVEASAQSRLKDILDQFG